MQGYLPFLLLLFLIAAFLRVDFFFTIVYLFFAVYLFSRLWMQYAMGRLQFHRRFIDRAFCGDRIQVDLALHNAGWLPIPWLEIHESLPVALITPPYHHEVISLGVQERHRLRYTLDCQRRGYYPVGPLTVRAGDLLGIVRQQQAYLTREHVIVYPKVVSLQQLGLPARAPQATLPAHTALIQDPARLMGVRDYQRGDSFRRIHWSATASSGRLLVKQYQPAIARETLICLDLDSDDFGQQQRYVAAELAIVTAASLANHVITREGLPAGLATEAWDSMLGEHVRFFLPPRSERAHLMSILEVLARVQVSPEESFLGLLRRESVHLSWGSTVAVVTGRETEALYDTLAYLHRAGLAVTLILVQPTHSPARLAGRAGTLGIPVHRVWNQEDLEGV